MNDLFRFVARQIMGDTSFNNAHLSVILASCEKEIRKNMTLYQFNNVTGDVTLPVEEVNDICESDCHRNGDCVESN